MIEICYHIIKETEIVGIGPLMSQRSKDPTIYAVYNSRKLWFYLHLRNQSVKIESDEASLNEEKDKAYLKEFERKYYEAKAAVVNILQPVSAHQN